MSEPSRAGRRSAILGGEVGIWTTALNAMEISRTQEAASEVEELGYGALWFGEAQGSREAFTNAALLLSATRRLVVATGIASIYARDAAAAKAAAMTLESAYPGRFVLGLGVSHGPVVEQRGHSYISPLKTMSEYLDRMDEAPFSAAGPEHAPPRVLAALGPKMLALSRDKADGAHPYLVTVEHTRKAREILGREPLLAVEQAAILSTDCGEALRLARSHLSRYLRLPNYRNSWLRQGFSEEDFAGGGSERLAEALVAWGDEEEIKNRVEKHLAAGADHVCIQVITENPAQELLQKLRRLAPVFANR